MSLAETKTNPTPPTFIAERAASFLNEAHDWDGLLKMLELAGERNQAKTIREYLKGKVDLKAPFPKFSSDKDKLVWGEKGAQRSLSINRDYTFNYQGNVFHAPSDKEFDLFIEDSLPRISQPKTSLYFLLVPPAVAANPLESKASFALGAIFVVGVLVFAVAASGTLLASVGAAMVIGSGLVLLALFANKAWQVMHDGGVTCDGPEFILHFQRDNQFLATDQTIPTNAKVYLKDENGRPLNCTPQLAQQLQNRINDGNYLNEVKKSPYGTTGTVR